MFLEDFAEAIVRRRKSLLLGVSLLVTLAAGAPLRAQGVCDAGNGVMDPAQPKGITPAEIIQKFSDKEAALKSARERYGYTLSVNVQTLDNYGRPDGQYEQTSEVTLNDVGKRVELTTFAPESTLRRLSLSQDDMDDIRRRIPFPFTTEELPKFTVTYVGRQPVDDLQTYVFDVRPKAAKKANKLFDGRLWVDDGELAIVKTCGKPREDQPTNPKKRDFTDVSPVFVTYREQVDRQYWFPTYARADELLRFPSGFVHLREVVKYTNYKPLPHAK